MGQAPPWRRPGDHPPERYEDRLQALQDYMRQQGHPIVATSKKRTLAEQRRLYAKGRSTPGSVVTEKSGEPGDESRHQLGLATDFAFVNAAGQPDYSEKRPWKLLGDTAKALGLEWGGDWTTLVDRPHVQLPNRGVFPKGGRAAGQYVEGSLRRTPGPASSTPTAPPATTRASVEGGLFNRLLGRVFTSSQRREPPARQPPAPPAEPPPRRSVARDINLPAEVRRAVNLPYTPPQAPPTLPATPVHGMPAALPGTPLATTPPAQGGAFDVIKSEPLQAPQPPATPGASDDPYAITKAEPLKLGGGGRGGPPPAPPSTGGRAGGPGDTRTAAASPPPTKPFYPGGARAAAEDFAGMVGGGLAATAAGMALPAVAPVAGVAAATRMLSPTMRVVRTGAGVAGAGAGGAGAAAVTGAPPTDPSGGGDSIWDAFKRQAEFEAIGAGSGWLVSALGRRMIGSRVARNAKEWLEATRALNLEDVKGVFQRAQDAIRAHATRSATVKLQRGQQLGQLADAAQAAKTEARGAFGAVAAEKAALPSRVEGIRQRGATMEGAVREQWPTSEAAVAPPGPARAAANPTAATAQAAEQVISGPSQRSLDILGQAVEEAAGTGPMVGWGPIQARLQEMRSRVLPDVVVEGQAMAANPNAGYFKDPAQARELLAKAGVVLEEQHPLPGVLGQIEAVGGDQIPFADAHRFKRLLDEAIGWKPPGAVTAPARTQLKQITKGIRGEIRARMTGHAPYDEATAAYREASTLFGPQGLARKIQAAAKANPEALVNTLVKVSEPTKLQMLREVLVDHAAKGGGAEAGLEAWQAVQSTVMYQHLIKPGLDNFDRSVAKMHPEFLHTLTGDPYARQVFERLRTMAEAVKGIREATAQEIRGARAATSQAVGRNREAGNQARQRQWQAEGRRAELSREGQRVDEQAALEAQRLQTARLDASRAVAEAKQPTAAERAFGRSSLSKPASAATEGSDVAYTVASPPGSPRQVAGAARLLLRGPRVNDLIQWASLSPSATQMFVRAVTGPAPGQGIAAMLRLYDWMNGAVPPEPVPAHALPKASPLTPPPGPRQPR